MFRDNSQRKKVGNVFYTLAHIPSWKDTADQRLAMNLALDIVRGTEEVSLMVALTKATRSFKKEWLMPFVVALAQEDFEVYDQYVDHFLPKAVTILDTERQREAAELAAAQQQLQQQRGNSMPTQVPM